MYHELMAASRNDISNWFDKPWRANATHMVVVCDTFDWEDYPVYVTADEDARTIVAEYVAKPMQKVTEVYNLSLPKEPQMAEHRAFNY